MFIFNKKFEVLGIILFVASIVGVIFSLGFAESFINENILILIAFVGALFMIFSKGTKDNIKVKQTAIIISVFINLIIQSVSLFILDSISTMIYSIYLNYILLYLIYFISYLILRGMKKS